MEWHAAYRCARCWPTTRAPARLPVAHSQAVLGTAAVAQEGCRDAAVAQEDLHGPAGGLGVLRVLLPHVLQIERDRETETQYHLT